MVVLIFFVLIGTSAISQASLSGDTVIIGHYYPDLEDLLYPYNDTPIETVVDGGIEWSYDRHRWYSYDLYTVDVGAGSIDVDFLGNSGWSAVSGFNGLVVSDLDYEPGFVVDSVTLFTNVSGFGSDRVLMGDDWVGLNFSGLNFTAASYISAQISFSDVPVPSAAILFGFGFIGLTILRTMRRNHKQAV